MVSLLTAAAIWLPQPKWAICYKDFPRMGRKKILVRIFKVDRQCAWGNLKGDALVPDSKLDKLTCLPEKNCKPIK